MPSDKQLSKVREWLLYAVTKAEKELGGGTGQIKLRYVYDMFVARFTWLARVTGFIISIPAALMWWGTPLIVGGLILYDTIQEKNPELCGFTAEEFDKEENK